MGPKQAGGAARGGIVLVANNIHAVVQPALHALGMDLKRGGRWTENVQIPAVCRQNVFATGREVAFVDNAARGRRAADFGAGGVDEFQAAVDGGSFHVAGGPVNFNIPSDGVNVQMAGGVNNRDAPPHGLHPRFPVSPSTWTWPCRFRISRLAPTGTLSM